VSETGLARDDEAAIDAGPERGPTRSCIVTRTAAPPDEMLRFVVGPDGSIVPDVAARLPGRGMWIGCRRTLVEEARRRKLFAKVARRAVTVADDLADAVERLLRERVVSALSMANKAGLVVAGFVKVEKALSSEPIAVLLHAREGADDGVEKLERRARATSADSGEQICIVRVLESDEMSLAIGRENVIHVAARTGGASRALSKAASRLEHYRSS
jgi:predicted RNA-binding protein YlxR (DUF448 family)